MRRIIVNTLKRMEQKDKNCRHFTINEIDDFIETKFVIEDPAGSILGVIERALYIYALFSQETVIIGGILTFKAFGGWTASYDKQAEMSFEQTGDGGQKDVHQTLYESKNLSSIYLYSYAIGNFLSLLISIIAFEIFKFTIHHSTNLRDAFVRF